MIISVDAKLLAEKECELKRYSVIVAEKECEIKSCSVIMHKIVGEYKSTISKAWDDHIEILHVKILNTLKTKQWI